MALSEEQRRKLAAKAAQQQSRSGANNSNIRRVTSTPSSLTYNNKSPKKSGGVNNKKLIIGAVAAVLLIVIGAIIFTQMGKNKQAPEPEASVVSGQNTAHTSIVPEENLPQNNTDEISDVGEGPAIVDNRSGVIDEENPEDTESEESTEETTETESETTETVESTEPTYSNESYIEIVTPKIDEPEMLDSKLRSVLGAKYESLDELENFGIHVLSYDRVASNGYIRISKELVDSGYDIGEHISTPLSINKDYEDGTQTARVTLKELTDLIDQAVNPTEASTGTETRSNENNSNEGGVRNPVVDENTPTDGQQTSNPSNDGTASNTEGNNDPMVGTMSGGEDFANSCYRVDETEPYDFDYLIQHINWSLTMSDKLVSVSKQNLTLNEQAAKDYIIVTLDPGIFCPSGRINFADFKKDLEASPYFVAYQRSGNTFSLVTDKTMLNQGYANSALANAANNVQ